MYFMRKQSREQQLKFIKLRMPSQIDDLHNYVSLMFTPTIPHCTVATLIGLAIKVKMLRCLPSRFKIDVFITPGSHQSEAATVMHEVDTSMQQKTNANDLPAYRKHEPVAVPQSQVT
ncbi:unnamed protein product [Soboliphyme baturini]|uniref:FeS_assembly_P domain-containing protein n=1 Tax=Soboliphyme baturini TaxID=241478 RepID=A0A183IJM9_9BILA|nr:unnamed protein product [Soboliphyme baturini]